MIQRNAPLMSYAKSINYVIPIVIYRCFENSVVNVDIYVINMGLKTFFAIDNNYCLC